MSIGLYRGSMPGSLLSRMHVDTVLLEFEGIIADTAEARRSALMRSLADEGVELTEAEYARACAGFPAREAAIGAAGLHKEARLDDTALELVALRAERYFAEDVGKGVALVPGATELIRSIHGRSRLAIVTRASRREVDFVLGLAGFDHVFDVIVTHEDVLAPKPSPEGYERALQRLAKLHRISRPTTSIALEDSAPGVLAARAVKIPVIAVGAMPSQYGAEASVRIDAIAGQTLDTLTALMERAVAR
jgi:HAD superfamily hydrolase (TIGR01509 family)